WRRPSLFGRCRQGRSRGRRCRRGRWGAARCRRSPGLSPPRRPSVAGRPSSSVPGRPR
ncbi:MAG: hypothetical protein AVDCRST_MAG49-800, partial [uncultured Thermomicrobiales bacterium]